MNNKGTLGYFLLWLLRVIFTAFCFIAVTLLISKYINVKTEASELEASMLVYRFLNNHAALKDFQEQKWYLLDKEKVAKLTNQDLNRTVFVNKANYYGAKLTIKQAGDVKVLFYDQEFYKKLQTQLTGIFKTGVVQKKATVPVLIYDGGMKEAVVEVEVLMPV